MIPLRDQARWPARLPIVTAMAAFLLTRLAPLLAVALVACGPAAQREESKPAQQQTAANDVEAQLGQSAYEELRDGGEIIASSPLYNVLTPIASRIGKAAQPRYDRPFNFILVHEKQPNAFSVPGGNIYVTDTLMTFVRNTEELAGVLCHEVSHTIHHDALNKQREDMRIAALEVGAVVLLQPSLAQRIAISMLGDARSNRYSRKLESAADVTGSDICAEAGYNPHGMIWLFEDFSATSADEGPEFLSDHPSMEARTRTLEAHFQGEPEVFAKYSADRSAATALHVPKDAQIVLMQPEATRASD